MVTTYVNGKPVEVEENSTTRKSNFVDSYSWATTTVTTTRKLLTLHHGVP